MSLKRSLAKAAGEALGFEIIPSAGLTGWPEDHFSQSLFRRLNVDCVFDVGANVGQYAGDLRRQGFAGTILSFEPGPSAFSQLRVRAEADPKWHVFNYAFGENEATPRMNIMKETAMSSFLNPQVKVGMPFSDVNIVVDVVEVPVKTIAETYATLASEYGFSRPFLKMDTQGFDLKVAIGAGDQLKNFLAIVSEVAVRPLYAGNPLLPESLETFSRLGFDMIAMHSVHPGNLLDPHEFNCYLLRRS